MSCITREVDVDVDDPRVPPERLHDRGDSGVRPVSI